MASGQPRPARWGPSLPWRFPWAWDCDGQGPRRTPVSGSSQPPCWPSSPSSRHTWNMYKQNMFMFKWVDTMMWSFYATTQSVCITQTAEGCCNMHEKLQMILVSWWNEFYSPLVTILKFARGWHWEQRHSDFLSRARSRRRASAVPLFWVIGHAHFARLVPPLESYVTGVDVSFKLMSYNDSC